jgi:hypothetical protein
MDTTTFVFDETHVKARIPDHVLLEALRRFVRSHPPDKHRCQDFNNWEDRPCTSRTIVLRFKGWRRAFWAAGLTSARRGTYSPEELIQILEQAWRKLGRAPSAATLRKLGRISPQLYASHWGSLKKARDLLARHMRGQISRDELLAPSNPPAKRHDPLRPALRFKVLHRDNYRCQLCGRTPTTDPDLILEIDHIKPVSKGGTDALENLRTLCRQCNRGKGATTESKAA